MGHASIRVRTTPSGGKRWDLMYRLAGTQRSETFTNARAANKWKTIFDAAGVVQGHAMLRATDPRAAPENVHPETVRELVERHVAALTGVTEGTRAGYLREATRDIYPTLGAIAVVNLTRDLTAAWTNILSAGLSGKTIANRHGLLSAACNRAVTDGLLADNPCTGMRLPRGVRKEMTILTPAEVIELADVAGKLSHDRYRDMVIVLAGTGLRWGEATALQVRHVRTTRDGLALGIEQAWKDVDHGPMQLGPPKSRRSRRTIPLTSPSPIVDAVGRATEGRAGDAWLFPSPRGNALRNGSFHTRVWIPAMEELKGRGWSKRPRVHDLRHTAVSLMLAAGQDITGVSRVLGHEKTSTTLDVYGHLVDGARESALAALGAALAEALPDEIVGDDG